MNCLISSGLQLPVYIDTDSKANIIVHTILTPKDQGYDSFYILTLRSRV